MNAQPTNLSWTSSSPPNPHSFRPPSAAYWRPPTATGLNRPEPPRGDYRPPPPGTGPATAGQRGHQTMWRRAQEEARYVIKIEQDRLDRLFASEAESVKRAEEALVQRRSRRTSEDAEYTERLLADEERRVQQERNRVNKLRADNSEWLSHLIKQETDRIHTAMIEDELEGRLTPEESQWLENNIQKRRAEEERQSLKRAQEEEAERLRKLEEEEEAAKLRAVQAEELAQAARLERFALPPIPDPEELSLALYSDPSSVDTTDDKALARISANPTPRPPKERTRRMSATSSETSSTKRMSTASAEESAHAYTGDAARRAWANNLKSEWDRRGMHEEHHTHLHPDPPSARRHPPQRSPSFSYRYQAATPEVIAAARQVEELRRNEELRRYREHQEEIKYREQQAARAAREAREAAAARKAFEEERKRLEEERKKQADERKKNEEQVVIAAWARYEQGWQNLINGVNAEGRPLTFYDIPWPVSMPARSFEELQSSAIEKFLLNPCHSPTKTRKMRLRAALMQWHPDKFAQRFVDRIEESHRTAILAAVNSVARTITELMNKEGES
ncbi:unnamed protein product [Rhizoctonia solani]|uniref:Uncharacterized protein n=1 Tax=Rhizoctonia solani TaxID=456999 RepID=A0A8H2WCD6_9AGAM|nr:unnamed protein product [Rhizoctonia solani]